MEGASEISRRELLGLGEYAEALLELVVRAEGALCFFDRDLSRLGFETDELPRRLGEFLRRKSTNSLRLLVHQADFARTHLPRLADLLRYHGHRIQIHETAEETKSAYDPFVVCAAGHYLRRFHMDDLRGVLVFDDPDGSRELVDRYEDLWSPSRLALSSTVLGL